MLTSPDFLRWALLVLLQFPPLPACRTLVDVCVNESYILEVNAFCALKQWDVQQHDVQQVCWRTLSNIKSGLSTILSKLQYCVLRWQPKNKLSGMPGLPWHQNAAVVSWTLLDNCQRLLDWQWLSSFIQGKGNSFALGLLDSVATLGLW